jgi:RNA polymerase sigma-70 factor (ECF subfamily)
MQQTIVRMRHMEGMEMAEIAELIGTSEVAVRKSLSRARQSILKKMNNEKSRGN